MKKKVDPSIYTKEYYLNTCLGAEEFKKFHGSKIHPRAKYLLSLVNVKKGTKVLDLGCGRGDISLYCARLGANVVGIDYSKDAIILAKESLKKQDGEIQSKVKFLLADALKVELKEDQFDLVICVDVFEHLYKYELEIVMDKISKILTKDGLLLVHTETNKLYLDYVHRFYTYPLSSFLIFINRIFNNSNYPGLPKDPRNEFHKAQHVNEPTYFYLKKLFDKYKFSGKIIQSLGLIKKIFSWKDIAYNIVVLLYPFSKFPPLIYLFGTEYICIMKNNKLK